MLNISNYYKWFKRTTRHKYKNVRLDSVNDQIDEILCKLAKVVVYLSFNLYINV